jgi:hypothetical protein
MSDINWGQEGKILNVFISSPDDVQQEREIVNDVLLEINRSIGTWCGMTLQSRMWENFVATAEKPLESIKGQLRNCDLFIMIFSRKFGKSVQLSDGEYHSGTQEEYLAALELREQQKKKRPEIHAYFKKVSDPETLEDPGPELQKILKFKREIQQTLFYKEYLSTEAFRPLVKDNITEWLCSVVREMGTDVTKDRKRSALRKFFDLGTIPGKATAARIIYPPLSHHDNAPKWDATHLLPYMVLEDFQAVNKITKILSMLGYEDVLAVTEDVYKQQLHDRCVNKIFLCLPRYSRNKVAAEYLTHFSEKNFQIEDTQEYIGQREHHVHFIRWKLDDGSVINVNSPQSKYLWNQRKEQESNWYHHAGTCFSVDFAVLAKFQDRTMDSLVGAIDSKAYFLFGIRGLGTWGAAWYIDHQYDNLIRHLNSVETHQQLLRVEFQNHRITKVEDVSKNTQDYFLEQNDDDYITKAINSRT